MVRVFTAFGFVAAVASVLAFVVSIRAVRGAKYNGHLWIARLGILGILVNLALSVSFLTVPFDVPVSPLIRTFSRIDRILSPLVIAAFIVYLGPGREPKRDRRDVGDPRRRGGGHVGPEESHTGVGGSIRRNRSEAA